MKKVVWYSKYALINMLVIHTLVPKGSSRIVNIIKSIHIVLFFMTPYLLLKKSILKMLLIYLMTPYENAIHNHNKHFKKAFSRWR